ncbi:MAG: hypothetical protein P8Z79_07410 [Sedimentisphaerales bacterium]
MTKRERDLLTMILTVLSLSSLGLAADLPADWAADWSDPRLQLRPLQIVHGVPAQQANPRGIQVFKELGLGGIVCNVDFKDYMVSEANWPDAIRICLMKRRFDASWKSRIRRIGIG